jgi:hypothetical protein
MGISAKPERERELFDKSRDHSNGSQGRSSALSEGKARAGLFQAEMTGQIVG